MSTSSNEKLTFRSIFAIRHDEYAISAIVAVLLLVLHYYFISRFIHQFAHYDAASQYVFLANFHMAGFDPTGYDILAKWSMIYDILRHPLLAWMMWPLYAINQLLWHISGMNCAQFIIGILLFFCAFYSGIFIYRLLRHNIGTSTIGATLLTTFFFTFAYVMVSIIVPDHFAISLFLLLLAIYISATYSATTNWQQSLIYIITAGVTLTNGIVVFLADIILNGKKAIMPKRLLIAYIIPTIILLTSVFCFQKSIASSSKWVANDVSRTEVVVENLFGETIQFHRKHILGDVLWRRPVIVRYLWWGSYVVEGIYVLLFALGIWYGRRERLLWLLSAVFLFTLSLHIFCGFALHEVQIMATHWTFVIPLAIGYAERKLKWINLLIGLIMVYLLISNFYLLHYYLTWPLTYK